MNLDLCLAMVKHNVDLVVIEGMGRTLHTNFHAKMKCECLKLAVVKNRWLALRLGGDMYAVICKYEPLPINMIDENPTTVQPAEIKTVYLKEATFRDSSHKRKGQNKETK